MDTPRYDHAAEPAVERRGRLDSLPIPPGDLCAAAPDGDLLVLAVRLMIEVRDDLAELRRAAGGTAAVPSRPAAVVKENYTTEEVAARTGYRPWTIRHWCNTGRVRAVKVRGGGRTGEWRVPHEELVRLRAERSAAVSRRAG